MPLNQLDVDDATSQGEAQADKWLTEIDAEFTKPYDKARAEAAYYEYLEKMFPGVPGKTIEAGMMRENRAQYLKSKQRIIDALGGKNGTVRG